MDDFAPAAGYKLSFPFEPKLGDKFQTQNVVHLAGHDLIFDADAEKDKAVFGRILALADAESRVTLRHYKVPYSLQISTSLGQGLLLDLPSLAGTTDRLAGSGGLRIPS